MEGRGGGPVSAPAEIVEGFSCQRTENLGPGDIEDTSGRDPLTIREIPAKSGAAPRGRPGAWGKVTNRAYAVFVAGGSVAGLVVAGVVAGVFLTRGCLSRPRGLRGLSPNSISFSLLKP
jgi:hypothetical protein